MYAEVAQLVEHHLAKVRVAGSSLVFRSKERFRTFLFCFDSIYLFLRIPPQTSVYMLSLCSADFILLFDFLTTTTNMIVMSAQNTNRNAGNIFGVIWLR